MNIIPDGKQIMSEQDGLECMYACVKRLKWLDDIIDSPYVTIKESPTLKAWYLDAIKDVAIAYAKHLQVETVALD